MCGRNKNISELVHNFKYFINLKISALVKYYLSSRGGEKKNPNYTTDCFRKP